ncbi:MAG: exodeoxyribonuclease VII large subunit, partial [Bacteroidota bacterium]
MVKLKVEYNIVHGLSANILDIDASYTLGNIEKQKLQTLMRLVTENPDKIVQEGENYVTFNKQLKLSIVLQRIALVTSQNSEGLHDFLNCILANRFGYKFAVDNFFTSVQGIQAEADLRNKMLEIYNSGVKYDCVVIIRGGGAKTDFAVFDTYGIARAVARFPFPVFTGIGHLRDVSITDMMAHTVSNTPTKAAELIIAHNRKFEEAVIQLQRTLVIKTQQFCALRNQSLNGINTKIVNESRNRLQEKNNFLQNLKQAVVQKSRLLLSSNNNNLTYVFSNLKTSIPFVIKQKNDDLKILNNIIPQ